MVVISMLYGGDEGGKSQRGIRKKGEKAAGGGCFLEGGNWSREGHLRERAVAPMIAGDGRST